MRLSTKIEPQVSRNMGIVGIALLGVLFGAMLLTHAEPAPAQAPTPALAQLDQPTFSIGPIEGLTSSWYTAPSATSIPLGTYLQLHQSASLQNTVTWIGAKEIARNAQGSTAACLLLQPGPYTVGVEVSGGIQTSRQDVDGFSSFCELDVVNIAVDDIAVSVTDVWVDPVEIDVTLPPDELNEVTMSYYFGESIAYLADLGDSAYRTSVNRTVHAGVDVTPPGFAPLMEWRIDDEPLPRLGPTASLLFAMDDIGNHVVGVGPIWTPDVIEIETYSVTITSHISGEDDVLDWEPTLFVAETNPPGYEDEITWLSSTKYGMAMPVLGQGSMFLVLFNDTWGVGDDGRPGQWLGVRAANAAFGQDGKKRECDDKCDDPSCPGYNCFDCGDCTCDDICDAPDCPGYDCVLCGDCCDDTCDDPTCPGYDCFDCGDCACDDMCDDPSCPGYDCFECGECQCDDECDAPSCPGYNCFLCGDCDCDNPCDDPSCPGYDCEGCGDCCPDRCDDPTCPGYNCFECGDCECEHPCDDPVCPGYNCLACGDC